jgi:hypothetical protein
MDWIESDIITTDKYLQLEQRLFHRQLRILLLQQFPTKLN